MAHPTATLTDRDLDEIEAQMDETSPIYLPALLRELRDARKTLAKLLSAGDFAVESCDDVAIMLKLGAATQNGVDLLRRAGWGR